MIHSGKSAPAEKRTNHSIGKPSAVPLDRSIDERPPEEVADRQAYGHSEIDLVGLEEKE